MFLIWGWRTRSKTLASGTFACPGCSADRQYVHKQARRWFTVFFIPLIPLKVLGEYIECQTCKCTYKPAVLSQPTTATLQNELLLAARETAVVVLGSDPTPAACTEARLMLSSFAEREWSETELAADVGQLDTGGLSARLALLAGVLTEQGKERLVGWAAKIASTGGFLTAERRAVVERIAGDIGMTAAHARGVIDEVVEQSRA